MLRLKNLGSGSSGNATLIEGSDGLHTRRLLVDCGLGIRQLEARLAEAGLALAQIDAIFITHEHGDHVGGVFPFARRHGLPVWLSHGTFSACRSAARGVELRIIDGDVPEVPRPGQSPQDYALETAVAEVSHHRAVFLARTAEPAIDVKTLHAKIGELTLVNDFLSGALGKAGLLSAKR